MTLTAVQVVKGRTTTVEPIEAEASPGITPGERRGITSRQFLGRIVTSGSAGRLTAGPEEVDARRFEMVFP